MNYNSEKRLTFKNFNGNNNKIRISIQIILLLAFIFYDSEYYTKIYEKKLFFKNIAKKVFYGICVYEPFNLIKNKYINGIKLGVYSFRMVKSSIFVYNVYSN
ncbi:hypothetical protein [Methanococcus voltae]|uniref:Uncharacterized protein n=2 Tax=Methanococcus voltae TaxID=2188 RepID=A0A8J7USU4_METVO|nr:hypothetical protein [Methanococcus voltae]MBP2172110.1 hypothetical protein [Methanococcus voltae]MBP2200933.1 hypothetical protein [Methanococcus voltae]MCS3921657.1 hypothetical protein [Methanococcus voltae PS]